MDSGRSKLWHILIAGKKRFAKLPLGADLLILNHQMGGAAI
jgi:hypothetical protein